MIQTKKNFVFDFESTLTRVEALDVLAEITLVNNPKKKQLSTKLLRSPILELTVKYHSQHP